VLAFGLAFMFLASRMTTREREAGKRIIARSVKAGDYWHFAANLILESATVSCF
jgi:hypothetical protein